MNFVMLFSWMSNSNHISYASNDSIVSNKVEIYSVEHLLLYPVISFTKYKAYIVSSSLIILISVVPFYPSRATMALLALVHLLPNSTIFTVFAVHFLSLSNQMPTLDNHTLG